MEKIPQKLFKAKVFFEKEVAKGVKKITFAVSEPFSFSAGQYVWVEIPKLSNRDVKGERRAFSICNVPNQENTISIVTRLSESGYKQTLFALEAGDEVNIHGPFGSSFAIDNLKTKPKNIIMIAGGVGIASFLATIESIKNQSLGIKVFLVYLNNKKETTPFLKEFEDLKNNSDYFDYIVKYDFFSWDSVKDAHNSCLNGNTKWWISGPQAMIDHVHDILKDNGVPIHCMAFENYYPKHKDDLTFERIKEQMKKEDLFAQIIQSSNNHTVVTDTNGVILFANKAAEIATGYSHEEILGNTPRLWGGMMDAEFYENFWSKKKVDPFFEAEIVNRHKSGKIYHAIAYITQIFNDEKELIGYIGMEKNISQKVEMEERVLLQYKIISELSTGTFGPALLEQTAVSVAEGLHWDFAAIWVPRGTDDDLHNIFTWSRKPSQHAFFDDATKGTIFKKGVGLPGRVFESSVSEWIPDVVYDTNFPRAKYAKKADLHTGFAFPIYEGGHIYAVFEFFSHEILPSDEYLLKTYYIIGHHIGQHWLKKEIDNRKSEFVSLASHQLRTPLTGVEWTAELFLKKEKLTDDGRKYLNDIRFSIKRLSNLVSLLLDVSRIESGSINVVPEQFDSILFIEEYIKSALMLCEKKELTCVFKEHPEKLILTTDKNLFGYIVQNIFSNATEYTGFRGKVEIMLEKKENSVIVKIKDTGIGIPKEEQPRIFEKFVRASNAITAKPDGSGLGLYIVSEAAKLLGGKIWFESKEGSGSTFFAELPLVSLPHNVGETGKTLIMGSVD